MDRHDRVKEEEQTGPIASVATGRTIGSFGLILFVVVLVEILLMIGLNLYQRSRVDSMTRKLDDLCVQLQSGDNRTLNDQVEQVLAGNQKLKTVIGSKLDWNKFYSALNKVTPKNVRLTSTSISDSGAFKAEGVAASFSSLAEAMVAWQQGTTDTPTPFVSITLINNGYGGDQNGRKVVFSINGQIDLGKIKNEN